MNMKPNGKSRLMDKRLTMLVTNQIGRQFLLAAMMAFRE
jgi:hypothetical protein